VFPSPLDVIPSRMGPFHQWPTLPSMEWALPDNPTHSPPLLMAPPTPPLSLTAYLVTLPLQVIQGNNFPEAWSGVRLVPSSECRMVDHHINLLP